MRNKAFHSLHRERRPVLGAVGEEIQFTSDLNSNGRCLFIVGTIILTMRSRDRKKNGLWNKGHLVDILFLPERALKFTLTVHNQGPVTESPSSEVGRHGQDIPS